MSDFLFEEFDPVSAKQWKNQIQFELKGADYNNLLTYQTLEGISIKPFYHPETVKESLPVSLPKTWRIAEVIRNTKVDLSLEEITNALHKGVESLFFTLYELPSELVNLLQKEAQEAEVYIQLKNNSEEIIRSLNKLGELPTHWFFENDIIHSFLQSGNWQKTRKIDFTRLFHLVETVDTDHFMLTIDTSIYQNAGATMVQQLAYSFNHLVEYLHLFENHNKKLIENIKIQFKVSVGSNYFFEIAKIRAIRILYAIFNKEYNLLKKCYIFTQPSERNNSVLDYNVNILRATTECMSAVLGGADTVASYAYDTIFKAKNEFSSHIARNQLHILKEESQFRNAGTMAEGSFYIEEITRQLVEKALSLFKEIEKNGGLFSQVKKGVLQKKIRESALKEQQMVDKGKINIVGATIFPSSEIPENTRVKKDKPPKSKKKTIISPIKVSRLTQKVENNCIFERKI
ncbi:methylmalonyl-CoA mutase family protein [Aquimarina sp. ERC-38]|uniref:methylmalonyl-CoA mutase family protein n=1 Tax=Aquimarina sp. ERC-38 TaxID=2949996 RepID=UPI0022483A43|nr:methylmalonyl-CoA mutase family protein [Aquimarina sp. ERC-38]UZO80400.1 methylmalonyl-CoA mutase family protein [Aquimarina sp. ERC-38]